MSERNKTALDAAFEEFEKDCGESKIVRREMIESLRKVVANPEMAPNHYDKAMTMQAKIAVFKTLDDLLNSETEISIKKLKMKLARKDSETNGEVGKTIVELLKNIRSTGDNNATTTEKVDRNSVMEELNKVKESNPKELAVSQGETEACGSSPTTDSSQTGSTLVEVKKDEEEEE